MAHISKEELLQLLITDPNWCIHYHRDKVKQLLPALTKAYVLTTTIEKGLLKELREKSKEDNQKPVSIKDENWILVERYVRRYPYDWVLIFKQNNELIEISVSEDIWRSFDVKGE